MKTFLSIDIDFWNYLTHAPEIALENLNNLYKHCRTNSVPLTAVCNHNQMLPVVNRSDTNQLINIDYHSDLTTNNVDNLNCGTWVSYVKQRKQSKYKWLHRSHADDGECNGDYPIFKGCMTIEREFPGNVVVDWYDYSHVELNGVNFNVKKMFDRENVTQVCICESPAYTNEDILKEFKSWRKSYNIPYTRGSRWDAYEKRTTPK